MKKLRVLIVEDDPFRMDVFTKEMFAGDDIHWAKDAYVGIRALKKGNEYDLVMLDHDLADEHYRNLQASAELQEGTGKDVARYMVTMDNPPPFAFVHSWNPMGAQAIGDILTEGGIHNVVATFGSKDLKQLVAKFRDLFYETQES